MVGAILYGKSALYYTETALRLQSQGLEAQQIPTALIEFIAESYCDGKSPLHRMPAATPRASCL